MRYTLWLLLPVIVSGCLGSSSAHGVTSGVLPPGAATPATSLRVSYPVGNVVRQRSQLAACPAGAACRNMRLPGCPANAVGCVEVSEWARIAVRRLTCSPSSGNYLNPGAACRALDDLERQIQSGHTDVCQCPMVLDGYHRAQAVGSYQHHRVQIALDECSLCGLGAQAAQDVAVLMPQA
jgi:hypothetical protein